MRKVRVEAPDRTNTQGLKINEEIVLLLHLTFYSSRIRSKNSKAPSPVSSLYWLVEDVKEPTH